MPLKNDSGIVLDLCQRKKIHIQVTTRVRFRDLIRTVAKLCFPTN